MKTLKHFFIIAILFIASTSWGATIYVSNTTSNGFTTGSDSNTYAQAQNMATPYLSITKATSASVSNGDTIVVNDGTYTMGTVEANYIEPARTGLILKSGYDVSIAGCTKWGPVLVGLAGQSRIIKLSGGSTFTIGTLTLNANNIAYCMDVATLDMSSLTITGTKFMNPLSYWLVCGGHVQNLTMSGGWAASATVSGTFYGFGLNGASASNGTYAISNGSITFSGTDSTHTAIMFNANPSQTGLTISLNTVTTSATGSGIGSNTIYGVYVSNPCTVSIASSSFSMLGTATNAMAVYVNNSVVAPVTSTGTTYTLNGTFTSAYGINCATGATGAIVATSNAFVGSGTIGTLYAGYFAGGPSSVDWESNTYDYTGATIATFKSAFTILNAAGATSSCLVKNLSGDLGPSAIGVAVKIGTDGDSNTNANNISGIEVSGCNLSNTDHGYFIGWQTGAVVKNNKVTNPIIGLIAKHATNTTFSYNTVFGGANNTTGGALRDKASDRTKFYNNTFVPAGASDVFMMTTQSDDTNTQSTNSIFKNNICYGLAASTLLKYASFQNTSTITAMDNNCYYGAGTLNANPWTYQASNYATFAAWKAGQSLDTYSLNSDPKLTSSTNAALLSTSPCINSGTFGLGLSTDYSGNSIVGVPDMGAYEYQFARGLATLAAQ